jgi:hypothetical protein
MSYTALNWELNAYAFINAQLVHVNLVYTPDDVRRIEISSFRQKQSRLELQEDNSTTKFDADLEKTVPYLDL